MANFYSIITNRGKELEAEALASGTKITLAKFVVGDGNGQATPPKPTQTKLVNEKYRGDIGELSVSPEQSTQMMAKIVLPTGVGGFTVREIGILTDAGELYAVANCAAIEKPVGGVSVNMQFRLAVSDTANITLNVATGDGLFLRIDQDLSEIRGRGAQAQKTARESLAIVDASTKQKGLVQLNSATNSASEALAATPKAVKAAYDKADEADKNAKTADANANTRLEKDKNLSDLKDKPQARKNLGLGSAATYDVQASPADATPGKLVPIGGFGLGAENTPVANINADAMRVSGFYGGPGISGVNYYDPYAALLVMSRYNTDGGMMQISANGKVAVRGRGFDKLSNWNELFGKLNPPTPQDCNALPSDGTALAANKLATARTIAGVSFDGTRNIDIPAGNVGAYTKAEVNSLIPTSSISGTSVKVFIWMGIMIQVGRVNGSVSSSTELTLPVAFKSYAQVLGSVDAASGNSVNAGVNMIGLGKITFTRASQYGPLTFLAIGDV